MKKIFLTFLIAVFILPLTSCVKHTPDTNGPKNFSLETITTDEILNTDSDCLKQGAVEQKKDNVTSINMKKFSGIETIHKFKLNSASLNLAINIKVISGNLEVVLCSKDDVLKKFRVNKGTQQINIPAMTDNLYLKVAGESASFGLSYEYDVEMSKGVVI